jgi:DnaK suppressor protein
LSTLTASSLEELGTQLRLRRSEVQSHIHTRLHGSEQPDTAAPDAEAGDDDGDAGAGKLDPTDMALLDHELMALRDIDGALERLDAGLAGVCAECAGAVPLARLLANPTAQTCIACQEKIEQGQSAAPSAMN